MPSLHIYKQIDAVADELVAKGLVKKERLDIAREKQRESPGRSLCELMLNAGFIDKRQLLEFIGAHLDVPVVDPLKIEIDPAVMACIPAYLARQCKLLPFEKRDDRLMIVMADPVDPIALSELQSTYAGTIEICIGLEENISQAILKHYAPKNLQSTPRVQVNQVDYLIHEKQLDKLTAAGDTVVNVVNNLIIMALDERASDIHLDPMQSGLKIRLRIDGTIFEIDALDKVMQMAIVSRVKVMAELDISEKRVPQDGRARVQVGPRLVDLRIATYPTMWGEKVSIRILTKNIAHSMDTLGLSQSDQKTLERIILQPHGLFLVTGPTGSGKTTTLYSSFMRINRLDKHAIAIEDPIENEIIGVNQAQVNVKAGITFSTALRAMLRHDPDIILVGEVRDSETADITARAAMTGHLVFSTLHTNSAIGAITRLMDLGLPPYLIASSLTGIMGQRLVRKICPACKETYDPTEDEKRAVGDKVTAFWRGKGCDHCRQTGFAGRLGVYEVIEVDNWLRDVIGRGVAEQDINEELKRKGLVTMWDDGRAKINAGVTTVAEVIRACRAG